MRQICITEYVHIDIAEIIPLYESVGWKNYTDNPSMLESAYKNSLKILAAQDEDKLIGILRTVGDGYSILYIQDIIVLPEYQGTGIGARLISAIDEEYPSVYQKVLVTDHLPSTVRFYEKCGFKQSELYGCTAFIKFRKQSAIPASNPLL